MRQALLKTTPAEAPGLTQSEMRAAVLPHLLADLFPAAPKPAGGPGPSSLIWKPSNCWFASQPSRSAGIETHDAEFYPPAN